MKTIIQSIALVALVLFTTSVSAQKKRTIDFVGGARSFISNNKISAQDSLPDSVSIKRNTGGYALIDLGVDIRPNKHTEIMGMFRIRNNYGGFWGAGVTFDVRQLWLKGVIGNVVRYQLGDLNLKQTPFTLYNHQADRTDSLPAIFKLQSNIIAYERFYRGNTWRQQGANVDFGFKFAKYAKSLDVMGYITRLQASNFTTIPDRLMSGVSLNLTQSEHFKIGYNGFWAFDVKGTIPDSNAYKNTVNTINMTLAFDVKDNKLEVKGEAGKSHEQSNNSLGRATFDDYFAYGHAKFAMPAQHLDVAIGGMAVGPDFRSVGTQSKNINYDATSNYYNRYGNAQVTRPTDLMDMVSNYNIYTTSVKAGLMPINPIYNNVLPYGIATFNRKGFFAKANYKTANGILIRAEQYVLSEIRGQGTMALKNFMQTKLTSEFEINKLVGFKRLFKVQLGANIQNTKRTSDVEVEDVSLRTIQYQAGLELEVLPKIDILAGVIALNSKGNEFVAERNSFSTIEYFENAQYDLNQRLVAFGARCRFNEQIYLCAMYQMSHYQDNLNVLPDYDINQFSLIYNMTF